MVGKHIPLSRMWDYVRVRAEITFAEYAHLVGCRTCMKLFTTCVHAESPDKVVWDSEDDDTKEQKSA